MSLMAQFRLILASTKGKISGGILLGFTLVALFPSLFMPYDPMDTLYVGNQIAKLQPPSGQFIFGTTQYARDVLSQLIMSTKVALLVGAISAVSISFIGTNIGLWAGYHGGWVENVLMGVTDVLFGIPFIPFAIILVTLLGPSPWNIILTISLLLWRTTARVIRSQVLTLKERPFIDAARVSGASDLRIMYVYILPNVIPLSLLYVVFGLAWAIMAEASLSFLGFGDPRVTSWGLMLHEAFSSGSIRYAWWWVIPPGAAITLLVMSVFMFAQVYEQILNPRLAVLEYPDDLDENLAPRGEETAVGSEVAG